MTVKRQGMSHNMLKFLRLIFLCLSLQACTNAAITGAQAVYNRHNIQTSLKDHYITMKSERSIYIDTDRFKNTHVSVSSYNGVVLILGQVQTQSQKLEIAEIVKNIAPESEIHNLITVSPPLSSLTQLSDSWITSKVKSKLLATNDIDATQIKVITENGVVYLMGIIPHDQADTAIELARNTDGVQTVVKIFSYLKISKT